MMATPRTIHEQRDQLLQEVKYLSDAAKAAVTLMREHGIENFEDQDDAQEVFDNLDLAIHGKPPQEEQD